MGWVHENKGMGWLRNKETIIDNGCEKNVDDNNIKTEPPDGESEVRIKQEIVDFVPEDNFLQQCPGCEITFVTKYKLEKHIAVAHGWLKPHPCTMCESSFSSKGNLKVHIETVHEKIRTFECTICNKVVSSKRNLQNHIRSAHDVKNLNAGLCGDSCGIS